MHLKHKVLQSTFILNKYNLITPVNKISNLSNKEEVLTK